MKRELFDRKYRELKVAEFEGGRPPHSTIREMAWQWARTEFRRLHPGEPQGGNA